MAIFTKDDDLAGAEFRGVDLRGARFVGSDLNGCVMRGVDIAGTEIDSPWLVEEGGPLLVNGVDVVPFVDAELNLRFPGREQRRARDPEGLRSAWAALEATWAATCARAVSMPEGTVDIPVKGEWSFSQTLRHLVLATDMWLGKAVLRREQPFHPLGQLDRGTEGGGFDESVLTEAAPTWDEVLEVRADRVAMVRDFLARTTPQQLGEPRANPHDPSVAETVMSCLHTILEEEWEHHRYAVRDLDALATGSGPAA